MFISEGFRKKSCLFSIRMLPSEKRTQRIYKDIYNLPQVRI